MNRLVSLATICGWLILLIFSVLVADAVHAQASQERLVAVRAGGLLEVETGKLIGDAVVLIRGERIEAVGPQVRIPSGAEVIDLSDYVVLPGLIDAHTHVCIQPGYASLNPILYKSIPYRTVEAVNAAKATLEAGFTTIEHGFFLDDEALDMMVANGTFWVPTISVYIPDSPREAWSEVRKAIIDGHADTIRRAAEKGVKIAYGTDAGALPHGDNAIDFERMVTYGMTPLQAVQSAMLTAAELMQMDGDVGTLTPGAFADLIAVPANPLDDVNVLGDVRFVMKGGAVIKHVAAGTARQR